MALSEPFLRLFLFRSAVVYTCGEHKHSTVMSRGSTLLEVLLLAEGAEDAARFRNTASLSNLPSITFILQPGAPKGSDKSHVW
jgi:hypothetical protein